MTTNKKKYYLSRLFKSHNAITITNMDPYAYKQE